MIEEKAKPINWSKDSDELMIQKINAQLDDTKSLYEVKCKQYREKELYIEGNQHELGKPRNIYNHLFPIVRNMTGLITDVKPTPSTKVTNITPRTPEPEAAKILDNADNLDMSLNEWWEDNNMQKWLQRIMFSAQVYDDFFAFPYWDAELKDVCFDYVHPRHVHMDGSADEISKSEFVAIDLYKKYGEVEKRWGAEKAEKLNYMTNSELKSLDDTATTAPNDYKHLSNVAHIILYLTPEWWCYKSGDVILKKMRNPFWALSADEQKKQIEETVRGKHKKEGMVSGAIQKVADVAKGVVGMETTDDLVAKDMEAAMSVFKPVANYFLKPMIPLIQFETYRFAGEQYSRSAMKQAMPTVDNLNDKKISISQNLKRLAKPRVYLHGSMSEEDANKVLNSGDQEVTVLPTKSDLGMRDLMLVVPGTPLPNEVFTDLVDDKRAIDNLFGHHEVSMGASDPNNQTKGGILALQEADQTPVRYITRNLEGSLQDMFRWVIQIRKVYKKVANIGDGKEREEIDYSIIDDHYQVFVKSGTMMPISREAQRTEARADFDSGLIDPLTYHERVNTPNPDKTAKRLETWIREKRVMTDDQAGQEEAALQMVEMIKQNQFDGIQVEEGMDARIYHDILLKALQSNMFTPEQEAFVSQLITQFAEMAGDPVDMSGGNAPPPVGNTAPVV